jgi:CRP-like cAMP-binding protein
MTENPALTGSPLMLGLSSDELRALLAIGEHRQHAVDDLIIREGTASDCLYVLEEGAVQVEREAGGRRIALARLDEPGDFFGEMSLISTSCPGRPTSEPSSRRGYSPSRRNS